MQSKMAAAAILAEQQKRHKFANFQPILIKFEPQIDNTMSNTKISKPEMLGEYKMADAAILPKPTSLQVGGSAVVYVRSAVLFVESVRKDQ